MSRDITAARVSEGRRSRCRCRRRNCCGQGLDGGDHRLSHRLWIAAGRKMQELHEPGGALDQGADLGELVSAHDQIALRKTEAGPGGLGVAEDRLALWSLIGNVRPALLGALAAD